MQALEPVLHLGNAAFEPCRQRLVGEGGPDNGGQDFVQVGEALDRIGEGLLVDLGVFRPQAVADGSIGGGRKSKLVHWASPSEKFKVVLIARNVIQSN